MQTLNAFKHIKVKILKYEKTQTVQDEIYKYKYKDKYKYKN